MLWDGPLFEVRSARTSAVKCGPEEQAAYRIPSFLI